MYALVDCNNFYVSCERVFNPKLEGKPVIVLSNNDGCAIARSQEAKELGIEMTMPFYLMADLVKKHNIKVFSSNYTLYGDMSDRVMKILTGYAPAVELYSIDEAFLDFTGLDYQDVDLLGRNIRKSVGKSTGIPVTVGIAATKTLAKMANRYAKRQKRDLQVHCIGNNQLHTDLLSSTEVGDIWGIGSQYEKLLLKNGFKTAADLTLASDEWIRKRMSVVGHRIVNELRGIPSIRWENEPGAKKGICTSRSFGELVTRKDYLNEAVSNFASNVALKLRKQNSCAGKVNVFIQTHPFRIEDPQYSRSIDIRLEIATSSTAALIRHALHGLDLIYAPGYKFLKAGVIATEIVPDSQVQNGMFEGEDRSRSKQLMSALDNVNKSMGKDIVRFAVQGYEKKWKLKAAHLSKKYTTHIDEVLVIKI